MAKVTLTIEDTVSDEENTVTINVEFDPPAKRGIPDTPAMRCAAVMLQSVQGNTQEQ